MERKMYLSLTAYKYGGINQSDVLIIASLWKVNEAQKKAKRETWANWNGIPWENSDARSTEWHSLKAINKMPIKIQAGKYPLENEMALLSGNRKPGQLWEKMTEKINIDYAKHY